MKHQINTIREALEFFECGSYSTSKALTALTALSELEAMAGEQEPCGWFESPYGAFRANPLLNVTFPASTLTWQIPAFIATPPAQQLHARRLLNLLARIHGDGGHYTAEHGLEKSVSDADQKVADLHLKAREAQQPPEIEVQCPVCSHKFYEWPKAKQTQYEAGDMASAHNDGFRAGVASVAQQPQAEPFGYVSQHTNGSWEFSPTPAGVYPDTAKSITAVYTKQPQTEAHQECDSRPICRVLKSCAGQYGSQRICSAAPQQAETVPSDVVRMDWIAMHGSFGVDSVTGLPGGNGQKRIAATRAAIDTAMAQGANHG